MGKTIKSNSVCCHINYSSVYKLAESNWYFNPVIDEWCEIYESRQWLESWCLFFVRLHCTSTNKTKRWTVRHEWIRRDMHTAWFIHHINLPEENILWIFQSFELRSMNKCRPWNTLKHRFVRIWDYNIFLSIDFVCQLL